MALEGTGSSGERPGEAGALRGGAEPIGAYLARQRQLRGISLDELAQTTRIPLRSLQRLESGAYDVDPDGFVRGFVRTVALALGLSPHDTIARMLPEAGSDREPRVRRWLRRARRLGAVAAVVLVAGSLAWMFLAGREAAPRLRTAIPREDGLVVRHNAVRALAEQAEREGRLLDVDAERPAGPPPALAPEPGAADR